MLKRSSLIVLGISMVLLIGCLADRGENTAEIYPTGILDVNEMYIAPAVGIPVTSGSAFDDPSGCPGSNLDRAKILEIGGRLYDYYCAVCHGWDGKSFPGSYLSPLRGGRITTDLMQPAVDRMLTTDVHLMMDVLSENDVLAIISYIRTSFGTASMVCTGDLLLDASSH